MALSFRPVALRRHMKRPEIDLSVQQLADLAGIRALTIRRWLSGEVRPRLETLAVVMQALAFQKCTHCSGLGYWDPTEVKRGRRTG